MIRRDHFREVTFKGEIGKYSPCLAPNPAPRSPAIHNGKKKPTTRSFFFSQLRNVYVTQSSLERPFHVARDMTSEREFRCTVVCMSQFHCENEAKQGHKVQTNKL